MVKSFPLTTFAGRPDIDVGGEYQSLAAARAALEHGKNNPTMRTWSTSGLGGYVLPTGGYMDDDGRYLDYNGNEITRPILGVGRLTHGPGYRLGDIDLPNQPQMPENPGIREQAFSTHGISIPISIGARAITGNVIDSGGVNPRLIGYREYYVEYKIPVYTHWGSGGGGGPGPGPVDPRIRIKPEENRLPDGYTGTPYNFTLWAEKVDGGPVGTIVFDFNMPSGDLFPGVYGYPDGTISGVPSMVGYPSGFSFAVTATELETGETHTKGYTVVVPS